jgi:hypothetical protein
LLGRGLSLARQRREIRCRSAPMRGKINLKKPGSRGISVYEVTLMIRSFDVIAVARLATRRFRKPTPIPRPMRPRSI